MINAMVLAGLVDRVFRRTSAVRRLFDNKYLMMDWWIEKLPLKNHKRLRIATLAIGAVAVVGFLLYLSSVIAKMLQPWIDNWLSRHSGLGYVGLFAITLLANSSIVVALPSPAIPLASAMSVQDGLPLVVLIFSLGAIIGESETYFLGLIDKKPERFLTTRLSNQLRKQLARKGIRGFLFRNLSLTTLAISPLPPFDAISHFAGGVGYPLWEYFVFCLIGRIIKYSVLISSFRIWD